MEIKPIKRIPKISSAQITKTKIDANQPRSRISLQPPPGDWAYRGNQIILNGQTIAALMKEAEGLSAGYWFKLAKDLEAYRRYMVQKHAQRKKKSVGGKIVYEMELDESLSHLCALAEAYIGRITRQIHRRYDETADGIAYKLDENGQLLLNGMNVTQFIQMAKKYPTGKAKIFLKGLKSRLSILLSNKRHSSNYEKIRESTERLFSQIDDEIQKLS